MKYLIPQLFLVMLFVISCKQKETTTATENKIDPKDALVRAQFDTLVAKSNPYFKIKNAEIVQTSKNGMRYSMKTLGKGLNPKEGDVVLVNYTGRFLNDSVFDSSTLLGEPLKFKIGSMIPGFNEAVTMLSTGGSGTFIVPPYLGYGDRTVKGPGGKVLIPANSYLVFDLDLIKVFPKENK